MRILYARNSCCIYLDDDGAGRTLNFCEHGGARV